MDRWANQICFLLYLPVAPSSAKRNGFYFFVLLGMDNSFVSLPSGDSDGGNDNDNDNSNNNYHVGPSIQCVDPRFALNGNHPPRGIISPTIYPYHHQAPAALTLTLILTTYLPPFRFQPRLPPTALEQHLQPPATTPTAPSTISKTSTPRSPATPTATSTPTCPSTTIQA